MTCQCSHVNLCFVSGVISLIQCFPLARCNITAVPGLFHTKKHLSLSPVTIYCAIIIVIHTFRLPVGKFCCEKLVLLPA